VVAGREDRAGRGRGRVSRPPDRCGLGEVPRRRLGRLSVERGLHGHRRARRLGGHLDHHALDPAAEPRDLLRARDLLRPLRDHRPPGGMLGADRRPLCPGRQARGRGAIGHAA
jgi:hypothetical protein